MRTFITMLCLLPAAFNVMAVEPVDDQQLMFYYHIPLGASNQQAAKHQFGLRLDRTTHDPGETVQLDVLEKRPADLDFRLNYDGVQSFSVHGIDYASYLVARAAAAEDETAAEAMPEEAGADTGTDEGGATAQEETGEEEKPADEKTVVQKTLDDLPMGVVFGVMLGIGILAGVGG